MSRRAKFFQSELTLGISLLVGTQRHCLLLGGVATDVKQESAAANLKLVETSAEESVVCLGSTYQRCGARALVILHLKSQLGRFYSG